MNKFNKNKNEKYINLKLNGRLFPSWILANFSRYKLPEIFLDDSDPCNDVKIGSEIRKYQEFVSQYLNYNSPYKDILLYHGLGSGKTRTAINVYNILYNYSPGWNVFILLKATLRDSTWRHELERWLQTEEKEFRNANISFISYDASNADKQFFDKVKSADASKKSMYIIDEVHNFISNVYTNLVEKQGRRALSIYEHIIQDKKDNDSVRVILISGSPAINSPFELAILFNLLRPNIFPSSESQFNQLYILSNNYNLINPANVNNFQRRIMGLVSHYIGSTPDYYAKEIIHYVDVPMSEYQELIYKHFEAIEEKIEKKSKGKGGNYKSYTSQSCNFVFPTMSQGLSGETRPRPKDFKISENDVDFAEKNADKKTEQDNQLFFRVSEYYKQSDLFCNSFDIYIKNKFDEDIKKGYTLKHDLDNLHKLTNGRYTIDSFIKYMLDTKSQKSVALTALYDCSAKMAFMVLQILYSPGPVLVYSNNVVMEGFQIFKIYLKYFGFSQYFAPNGTDFFKYIEFHGKIDKIERKKVIDIFNRYENKTGEKCKIIMISPAGAEGITLKNVRQVHIMEPYWQETRIKQMIGRATRQCSHKDLPKNERLVDIFRYKSIRTNKLSKQTTDQYKEQLSQSKDRVIQSFLDAIKETAVDCVLNKAHNSLLSNHKCFQFEEQTLFDNPVGPAYRDDIYEDVKMNNGLNAPNTQIKRIKVVKISAVKQLVSNVENEIEKRSNSEMYSDIQEYWFNPDTLIVYDVDLQYPVGRVGANEDNIPLRLDATTYIITYLVPIPHIRPNKN
jgi:superfamily II DNA or RNA helicase